MQMTKLAPKAIRFSRIAAVVSLLGLAILSYLASPFFAGVRITVPLISSKIVVSKGKLFEVPFSTIGRYLTSCEDTNQAPRCSGLTLYESGRAIGPAHSLHAEIADKGAGRYSHWAGYILFSSSDGTDPRTNGRRYEASVPLRPAFGLIAGAALPLCAIFLGSVWFEHKRFFTLFRAIVRPWSLPSAKPHHAPAYRPDIDGLRAVAVVSVVLNHYGFGLMPGGFTGVDIFFVISGYLITGIIWSELSRGDYSVTGFYARRFRRILPALLLVLAATLLGGFVLTTPGMYVATARSAMAAAGGVSNLFFYGNTGYFDQNAQLQPLLHTWSLGVEEQFYLIWPIVLSTVAVYSRHSSKAVIFALGLIVLTSFAASTYYVFYDVKWAFYAPLTRAWELGIGALVVFLPNSRVPKGTVASVLGYVGAALICYSLFALDSHRLFPGPNALFACVGTALLIVPQRAPTVLTQALSLGAVRTVGLMSYSLYLWHWPLLVLVKYYNNSEPVGTLASLALLILALALSWATWCYIENPFRRKKFGSLATIAGAAASAAALASVALAVVWCGGFEFRLPPSVRPVADINQMWHWKCPSQTLFENELFCTIGARWSEAQTRAVLYGDSHAEHLAPLINEAVRGRSISVLLVRGCPADQGGSVSRYRVDEPGYREFCEKRRRQLLSLVANERARTVILAAEWLGQGDLRRSGSGHRLDLESAMTLGLNELMEPLAKLGAEAWLLGDVPWLHSDPIPCSVGAHALLWRRPCHLKGMTTARFERVSLVPDEVLRTVAAKWPNVHFMSLGERMCRAGGICIVSLGGEALYRDVSHFRRNLTDHTAMRLSNILGLPGIFGIAETASRGQNNN
jgi:peptidoglycan/LPS O-acetylase OafA/YrhL